jgi:hypothetical protein
LIFIENIKIRVIRVENMKTRVPQSFVLCVCFVDRCWSLCTFSFGHCVVCSSSIYGFRLPSWYLQTLLTRVENIKTRVTRVV